MTEASALPIVVKEKFQSIQILRGIAAAFVVACHLLERLVNRGVVSDRFDGMIQAFGSFGVYLFFAISGFIITYTYAGSFSSPPKAAFGILKKRFIRVAPIYYLFTALYIVFILVTKHSQTDFAEGLKSLLFIPYVNDAGLMQPVYEIGWTLNYEMFFYLLFSVFLFSDFRKGIAFIVGVIVALVIAGTLISMPFGRDARNLLEFYTRPVLLFFVIGVLTAFARIEKPNWFSPIANYPRASTITALFMLCVAPAGHFALFAVAIFALIIIGSALRSPAGHEVVTRFLGRVGDASYSLYLTHSFVLGFIVLAVVKLNLPVPLTIILSFIIALSVCVAIAMACYKYIETPLLRRLK